jgi:hypothetical protein
MSCSPTFSNRAAPGWLNSLNVALNEERPELFALPASSHGSPATPRSKTNCCSNGSAREGGISARQDQILLKHPRKLLAHCISAAS